MIENQAARLGDLSIENKKLKQAVEVGKSEMTEMREQISRLSDLILRISNREDPFPVDESLTRAPPRTVEDTDRLKCGICTGDSKGQNPCSTCGYDKGYVYPTDLSPPEEDSGPNPLVCQPIPPTQE